MVSPELDKFRKVASMALKDKKIAEGHRVDPALIDAIRASLKDGKLDCAAAFVLARKNCLSPLAAGKAADFLDIHLSHCQLGLFGFPGRVRAWESPGWKEAVIPEGLEAGIRSSLDPDGSLSCAAAWAVADRFVVGRAQVGFLANRLKIKIKTCQLGAF